MSDYIKNFDEFDEINEFYAPNISSLDPLWDRIKGVWTKFKGLFARSEPPKYQPNQFRKGDEVEAYGKRQKVQSVSDKDKDRWIEVEDSEGRRRRMLYDTIALRKKRMVGEDFYAISNVYGQGYEQGRWKYDRKTAPGSKTGYGRTRSSWGYRTGSALRAPNNNTNGGRPTPNFKPPVVTYKMPR